jgi:DNA-directed RNA polymerase specialized sigma24 family protein
MPTAGPDTDDLLARSAAGDRSARGTLLERHQTRLQRMLAIRLDRRLAARVYPSDIVQETLTEAAGRGSGVAVDGKRSKPIAAFRPSRPVGSAP